MGVRAGIILVSDGRVAAIERVRAGLVYHLLPGGMVEAGEDFADAAIRETAEELGLDVRLGSLAATVHHEGAVQHYFFADVVAGAFGTGDGPEMDSPAESESGSYRAVWLSTGSLVASDLRPRPLAALLQETADVSELRTTMQASPMTIHE